MNNKTKESKKEEISKRLYDSRVKMFGEKRVAEFYVVKEVKKCPTCGQEMP